jgi:LmbE family N-acetylglucosaminyl deacetylase
MVGLQTMRWAIAFAVLATNASAQRWVDVTGRTPAGRIALHQAAIDAGTDARVLLVASHPDDRYLLPAVWLRSTFGMRVSVLLATRGGGGQNSAGPQSGDELERLRTLEAEVGCARLGCDVLYLDRPDGGYRRSAAETFAEWGREQTLQELVRLLRTERPDAVVTTHHAEETHGHDLALVELLPEAIRAAGDPAFQASGEPHRVRTFLMGAGSSPSARVLRIDADQVEPERGASLRRLAHDVLREAHTTPGSPAPMAAVFDAELRLEPQSPELVPVDGPRPLGLPSVFDADRWEGDPAEARELEVALSTGVRDLVWQRQVDVSRLVTLVRRIRALVAASKTHDNRRRLQSRLEAVERLTLLAAGVHIEVEVPPGTAAIAGEEFEASVQLHGNAGSPVQLRVEGLGGVDVTLEPIEAATARHGTALANLSVRMPLGNEHHRDPMAHRFQVQRFVPPVRVRFFVQFGDLEIPADVTVPVEQRAPVDLAVVPRMLLLPSGRRQAQFSIGILRNSRFPVEGELVVRGPAGYAIPADRHRVTLDERRSEMLALVVEAPPDRRTGVDILRIQLGNTRVDRPVHTVEVQGPTDLRVGLLRSRDDTLPNVLGVGGFGVRWTELSDDDIAVADLSGLDTIVVDIRALRDRPAARRGFRRLLDFATGKGRRLVVFYQKDSEFHPPGEGFVGAPITPFVVGKNRVTRADAPVRVLRPDHVLLQQPNVIEPADWDGWEQERALYLPSLYAGQYEELLELNDPDQPSERGALLYARTGDGEFVYCALSLWRQLKKLHPGAVRLLANLVTPRERLRP